MAPPTGVVVHPLVLLSVVDHYNRLARDTSKRVVGVLLGEVSKGKVDVLNSYAVPFEEDERNPSVWFLDHDYHENMFGMFKKVNAREQVVGWYSTGPKIRPADLAIHEVLRWYTPNPVLVIIDVTNTAELGLPTKAYATVEEVPEDGTEPRMTFQHISSEIGALEAEEVGVEHLLRDVKDTTVSTLATQVHNKVLSLKSLLEHLQEMQAYLRMVAQGRLPPNHQIIEQLQDIFNLLPNLHVEELVQSFSTSTNDMALSIYLASMIRSVLGLHSLINNKLTNSGKTVTDAKTTTTTTTTASADGKKDDAKKDDAKKDDAKKGAADSSKEAGKKQ